MKRTLLSLSTVLLCFFSHAQRSVDLQVEVTSHFDGDFLITEGPIDFTAEVLNVGTETLEATDSVYYYIIISTALFTDSFSLVFGGGTAEIYTGIPYFQGQSFTTLNTIGFSAGFNGETGQLCAYAKLVNATSPISDPVLENNKNCVSVTFIDEAELSVGENDLSTVKLTPNPASNSFSITGLDSDVSIVDLNGNTINFERNLTGEIDCSSWSNGVYLVNMSNASGAFVKRLVVSH
ncbi:hypothetical protein D3C71_763710 [compost metagenome]